MEAVIVSAVRTPCGRSKKGSLAAVRPEDMAATAIRGAIERVDGLQLSDVDDVLLGCAMPEGPQGLNIARVALLRAGLPDSVPGATVNRFCSSGLQTVAQAAERIMAGGADVIVAGGVESMTQVPMTGFKLSPHPQLVAEWPEVYMPMGITAELVARQHEVSRQQQDEFAAQSQRRAAEAIAKGLFADEIVPVRTPHGMLDQDELPRPGTTVEKLARLRPVFQLKGTITAGNSSPLTDGAAAVVITSRARAQAAGWSILATFRGFSVAGVAPEVMGIGPIAAVPKLLSRTGVKLEDVGHIELNEAFASQSIAVIRELGLDASKVNPQGGAIALGHPLGATGAKLTATLVHAMKRNGHRYGMVTMCVGGGMGAAGLFEAEA